MRDVLSSHQVQPYNNGFTHVGDGMDFSDDMLRDTATHSFLGPLYNASYDEWKSCSDARDKALIVLRDPRDLMVSWMFSVAYSHISAPMVDVVRDPLLKMNEAARLQVAMTYFAKISNAFRSWAHKSNTKNELIVDYDEIVSNSELSFRRIMKFLGWRVPSGSLDLAIKENAFTTRSGREPGEEDIHSHYRKGLVGDWRNQFDRLHGQLFEGLFPGLLKDLNYENDCDWYKELPDPDTGDKDETDLELQRDFHEMKAEITRMREHKAMLERVAGERLNLINRLTDENKMLLKTCEERLELIKRLDSIGNPGTVKLRRHRGQSEDEKEQ